MRLSDDEVFNDNDNVPSANTTSKPVSNSKPKRTPVADKPSDTKPKNRRIIRSTPAKKADDTKPKIEY